MIRTLQQEPIVLLGSLHLSSCYPGFESRAHTQYTIWNLPNYLFTSGPLAYSGYPEGLVYAFLPVTQGLNPKHTINALFWNLPYYRFTPGPLAQRVRLHLLSCNPWFESRAQLFTIYHWSIVVSSRKFNHRGQSVSSLDDWGHLLHYPRGTIFERNFSNQFVIILQLRMLLLLIIS